VNGIFALLIGIIPTFKETRAQVRPAFLELA